MPERMNGLPLQDLIRLTSLIKSCVRLLITMHMQATVSCKTCKRNEIYNFFSFKPINFMYLNAAPGRFENHRLKRHLEFMSEFSGSFWHVRDGDSENLQQVIGRSLLFLLLSEDMVNRDHTTRCDDVLWCHFSGKVEVLMHWNPIKQEGMRK